MPSKLKQVVTKQGITSRFRPGTQRHRLRNSFRISVGSYRRKRRPGSPLCGRKRLRRVRR